MGVAISTRRMGNDSPESIAVAETMAVQAGVVIGIIAAVIIVVGMIAGTWMGYITPVASVCTVIFICTLTSFIIGGVAQTNNDKNQLKQSIYINTVANSIAVILIGIYVAWKGFDTLEERDMYLRTILPLTLIISLVSVSSVCMNKLAAPVRW